MQDIEEILQLNSEPQPTPEIDLNLIVLIIFENKKDV
jgi:hypothetical protein